MADFLLEIGMEEVPARMIAGAQDELVRRTVELLTRERLVSGEVLAVGYSTPRRLAIRVWDVAERQEDVSEDVMGPAAKIAFKDGVPTPAAEAFARKNGVGLSELRTVMTPKGEYLAATNLKKGRSAIEVITAEMPKEVAAIYWAKNMYWRAGKPEKFVRPVEWIVCLFGGEGVEASVVPFSFGGKAAGRVTYGHRVLHGKEPITLSEPMDYEVKLRRAFVEPFYLHRKQTIRKALDRVTREVHGARWREDEALVDAVTHLTEWPDVLLGGFEPEYLELPEEVLVTVMRDHQKYFAVEDLERKLAPHFLTVTNIALDEGNAPIIRQGNERVLRARFNDARFFWEFDQKISLVDRVPMLEKVTFQKDLGSYGAKSERVWELCRIFVGLVQARGSELDFNALKDAAYLAKTDLTTELVKEFTELQGQIGGLYAKSQGISDVAAEAIYDQYLPASAKDRIPRSAEGCVLGLADRMDTIAGMFGLGMEPTGSKDPFALRRAANAVVRISAESGLPLLLSDVVAAAGVSDAVAAKLKSFFAERVEFYLRDACGQAYDVVKAVVAAGSDDLADAVARAEAVTAVRGSEDFLAVSAAFKRMKNIVAQARAKGDDVTALVDPDLLLDASEKMLSVTSGAAASAVEVLQAERRYAEALRTIAMLRPAIDDFFEKVMVMSPEMDIRANRLALLSRTLGDFSKLADFSEIVVAG